MITILVLFLGLLAGLLLLPYILIGLLSVAFAHLAEHADCNSIYNLMLYSDINGKPKADYVKETK